MSLPSQLLLQLLTHAGTDQVPKKDLDMKWIFLLLLWIGEAMFGLPGLTPRGSEKWVTSCRTLGKILTEILDKILVFSPRRWR